jgi:hypothetical protein
MTEREYRGLIAARLSAASGRAVAELKVLLSRPEAQAPNVVDIEIFPDSLFDGLPIRLFFMKPDGGSEVAPSHPLLNGDPDLRWSEAERVAIIAAEEADPDLDIHSIDGQLFLSWVSECWREAAASSSVWAFAGEHDGARWFQLNTGKWVEAEEKWRPAS